MADEDCGHGLVCVTSGGEFQVNVLFNLITLINLTIILQGVCRYKCRADSKCTHSEGPCNLNNDACDNPTRDVCQVGNIYGKLSD